MLTQQRLSVGGWVVLAIVTMSLSCGGKTLNIGRDDAPLAKSLGRFQGTMPCTDCAGIRVELQLFAEAGHNDGTFELSETALRTKDGDRSQSMTGNWILERGIEGDAAAAVYRLNPGDPSEQRFYLKVGDDTLELLDASRQRIVSKLNYALKRVSP